MTSTHRIWIAALVLATTAATPAAAQTIAPAGAPTSAREYEGNVVFSQFDQASGQYRLAVRRSGAAAAEVLPVAPSTTSFDADIGPDRNGRPELIYQRCTAPRAPDCDLFVLSLAAGAAERPVRNANDPANADVEPTLWRGQIAWTRFYGTGQDANPIIYTKLLTAPRSRPSTRLPGVPQERCGDSEPDQCGPTDNRAIGALELSGENLAMTVGYTCAGCSGVSQSELRLVDIGERSASQVAFQVVGLSGQQLIGPSFFDGRLAWYRACLGDPSGCGGGGVPYRYALSSRAYQQGAPGPIRLDGFADTGSSQVRVPGCNEESSFSTNCRVEEVPAPAYESARRPER